VGDIAERQLHVEKDPGEVITSGMLHLLAAPQHPASSSINPPLFCLDCRAGRTPVDEALVGDKQVGTDSRAGAWWYRADGTGLEWLGAIGAGGVTAGQWGCAAWNRALFGCG
jgi:hypothetical protein